MSMKILIVFVYWVIVFHVKCFVLPYTDCTGKSGVNTHDFLLNMKVNFGKIFKSITNKKSRICFEQCIRIS